MNPYVYFLEGQEPRSLLATTTDKIAAVLRHLTSAALEHRAAPGKWNAREILCHVADCEIAFAFRLRQTLADAHHVIQPFDQDAWAAPYGSYTAADALDLFTSLRRANLLLIRSATPAQLATPVTHPERGTMTFQTIVETMAGHDINHLSQLERLPNSTALPSGKVSKAMPQAPILALIGMTLTYQGNGEAALTLAAQPAHANPMGTVHGGILCDLADFAMGAAFATTLEDDETFTSLELKINFLRPVWTGRLDARGKVVSRGRTIGLAECDIHDEQSRLIAHATSTCMVLRGTAATGR